MKKLRTYIPLVLIAFFAFLLSKGINSQSLPSAVEEAAVEMAFGGFSHQDSLFFMQYAFCSLDSNRIYDTGGNLYRFFKQLRELQFLENPSDSPALTLSIAHIGDSHVQAGMITEPLRRAFQDDFGNAGRGLIVPLKLARTNEPNDFAITSVNSWRAAKITEAHPETTLGIGGIGIVTKNPVIHFNLKTLSPNGEDNSFNSVTVFHHNLAPLLMAPDSLSTDFSAIEPEIPFATRIDLVEQVNELTLTGLTARAPYNQSEFYGFNLMNGRNGILYHSIGVNGACFAHHAKNENFYRQVNYLQPQLLIVSLGTNEAASSRFSGEAFYQEIDRFVSRLRESVPEAVIILTTPAENYRRVKRQYVLNQNIERAADVIKDYARHNKLAYWDLFNITGGKGSAARWKSQGLLQRDHIHYNREGYEFQGKLLYNALINEYREYLENPDLYHLGREH